MPSAADFRPRLQTRLLVLQPTPQCNIDCSYCYLPDRDDRARMTPGTARMAARRLREDGLAGPDLTVVWHAGEPLLRNPAFYAEAIGAIADELSPGTRVRHALQTNALLIDDAWCAFFLEHRIDVGVSVDGPPALHDLHRRTRRGAGTHAGVLRGIRCLQRHGVPFHAIAVVTAATLADPDAFCDWFEAHGIRELGCNFDEAEGVHATSSLQGADTQHAAFIARLLDRAAAGRLAVRELSAARELLARDLPRWHFGGEAFPDNAQVLPLALLTVRHDGGFGTFSPELPGQRWPAHGDFVFGNVHTGGYLRALGTPAFAAVWADVLAGVRNCRAGCTHFAQCGGGAPANKLYEHGHFHGTETLYCRSMVKRPFDAVLAQAERALAVGRAAAASGSAAEPARVRQDMPACAL